MDGSKRRRAKSSHADSATAQRTPVLQSLTRLFLAHKSELIIYYSHRDPVRITGPDAFSMYLWLQSGSNLCYTDYVKAMQNDLEQTNPGFKKVG